MRHPHRPIVAAGLVICACTCGCASGPPHADDRANPSLRTLQPPASGGQANIERATLARLVGAWTFTGSVSRPEGGSGTVAGRAAGVIEHEHFVLLDIAATEGQLAGRSGRLFGSLLFASEPGIGLTVTAWGDANPWVTRLVGDVNPDGSRFVFDDESVPSSDLDVALSIVFETDDRFVVEVRDTDRAGSPALATYVFTRSPG